MAKSRGNGSCKLLKGPWSKNDDIYVRKASLLRSNFMCQEKIVYELGIFKIRVGITNLEAKWNHTILLTCEVEY